MWNRRKSSASKHSDDDGYETPADYLTRPKPASHERHSEIMRACKGIRCKNTRTVTFWVLKVLFSSFKLQYSEVTSALWRFTS